MKKIIFSLLIVGAMATQVNAQEISFEQLCGPSDAAWGHFFAGPVAPEGDDTGETVVDPLVEREVECQRRLARFANEYNVTREAYRGLLATEDIVSMLTDLQCVQFGKKKYLRALEPIFKRLFNEKWIDAEGQECLLCKVCRRPLRRYSLCMIHILKKHVLKQTLAIRGKRRTRIQRKRGVSQQVSAAADASLVDGVHA
jgi:hypothetical protein